MKNPELMLLALPSAVMFGLTMYLKNIHDGLADKHAVVQGWTYGIAAAGFFVLAYTLKLVVIGT